MSNYSLLTDMTCDLPYEVLQELDIQAIPMAFQLGTQAYQHYPDERELSLEEFYVRLKAGEEAVTSQINPVTYKEHFEAELKKGRDILYLCFSSGLSGSVNSAMLVASQLKEVYPERTITVIDTLCASAGEGLLVYLIGKKRKEGMGLAEAAATAEALKLRIAHWFTVEDLYHLKRGGRVSSVEAIFGTALKIKPVLSVDSEGKLAVVSKERGTKKALSFLLNKLQEEQYDEAWPDVIVAHANAPEGAELVAAMVHKQHPELSVLTTKIGPIIGAHVGAGMCALLYVKKEK